MRGLLLLVVGIAGFFPTGAGWRSAVARMRKMKKIIRGFGFFKIRSK